MSWINEEEKEATKRRIMDYYLLAFIAGLVFISLSIGPLSDMIDKYILKPYQRVVGKAIILFFVVYAVDTYMMNNWEKFCSESKKYKNRTILSNELVDSGFNPFGINIREVLTDDVVTDGKTDVL